VLRPRRIKINQKERDEHRTSPEGKSRVRESRWPVIGIRSIMGAGQLLLLSSVAVAQAPPQRPRLVVVIVIDQLRPDYLQRFRGHFGNRGFNLLLQRGVSFSEARHLHAATLTCPGHATVLTGSHANVNGIISNVWYDAATNRAVNCAADASVTVIGAQMEGRSPRNLIDSTIGDELRLATNGRGKVVTVAGKDRSAIMLGGHRANGAYWMEDTLFVTSTYYMKALPRWVEQFNASGAVSAYTGRSWDRLLPRAAYAALGRDNAEGEEGDVNSSRTFPHRLGESSSGKFVKAFEASPYQNEVIADFAMRAVTEEELGLDEVPDLLAIGFSANDLIGHAYGPDSHEVMDATVRTDRLLQRFFGFLDSKVGLRNIVIVLTADHGVAPLPERVNRLNSGAGASRLDPAVLATAAETALRARFGDPPGASWIARLAQPWIYLNLGALEQKGHSIAEAERVAQAGIMRVAEVSLSLTATQLRQPRNPAVPSAAAFSFFPSRSGNIYYELKPYVVPGSARAGTTHGSPWSYDAQVPLLWFGASIKPGVHHGAASVADIAPTLSALLRIAEPAGSEGRILDEMFR
jgi:predicted AlkP superfamily pyrophosphatase or phosphodiesterase